MKVREVMSDRVIKIHPAESVTVAARTLEHYNVGVLPVCTHDGKICGMVTDRDLVVRCLAAGRTPEKTRVGDLMTGRIVAVRPDTDTVTAAAIMGKQQIRRLPVIERGKLCGMVSLGDLASREETVPDAVEALSHITSCVARK